MSRNHSSSLGLYRNQYGKTSFDILPDIPLTGRQRQIWGRDDGLPFFCLRFGESELTDGHWIKHVNYPNAALELILAGRLEFLCDEGHFFAGPGDLTILARGSNSRYGPAAGCGCIHKLHVLVGGMLAGVLLHQLGFCGVRLVQPENPGFIEAKMREIGERLALQTEAGRIEGAGLLFALFMELWRQNRQLPPENLESERLCWHGKRFLERLPEIPVGNAELFQFLGLGRSQGYALFQRKLGVSPHAYQQNRRLELAEKLLRDSELPIAAIAQQCGFCNIKYFITVFRRRYSMPPGKYRAAAGITSGRVLR